jgi:hypothetical protein
MLFPSITMNSLLRCSTQAGLVLAAANLYLQSSICRSEDTYENCDAIGDGLKAEFWKRFHANVDILSMEDESVQLMITHLRNGQTSSEA